MESEDEEEEPFENLNNIRAYQEMVRIVESTTSSPEIPWTGHVDIPVENNLVTGNEQLAEDSDYVDNGVDDEMDSVDIESEAEVFEDILDYEAEMERSQQSSLSASEYT